MSKKSDFLKSEQSRQRHPERPQVGRPAAGTPQESTGDARDRQEAHAGKVANDHNRQGDQPTTQTNQARRTPQSRHDRQTMGAGPQNQVSARKGGGGAGRGPRGSG